MVEPAPGRLSTINCWPYTSDKRWLKDARNKSEAIALLPQRLNMDAETAALAFDDYVRQPVPAITAEGMREVIDIVWDAEGYRGAKGDAAKYLDTRYLEQALAARA